MLFPRNHTHDPIEEDETFSFLRVKGVFFEEGDERILNLAHLRNFKLDVRFPFGIPMKGQMVDFSAPDDALNLHSGLADRLREAQFQRWVEFRVA